MRTWAARFVLALPMATLLVAGLSIGGNPIAVLAQESTSGVRILTPYVGVAVEPGDTESFDLELIATPGEEIQLEVVDVPDGWDALIRGGGFVVNRVMFDDELTQDLKLEVTVPAGAVEGNYQVGVVARGSNTSDQITFDLNVAQSVGGGVVLNAEFPSLRGPSDVEFSFTLELANETGEEIQFGLQAEGPGGWQVDARPAGQSRASSVTVAAGDSERVTVEVDPPDFTPAGTYPVLVRAAGSGETAAAELIVEITGNFDMALITPDDRLNLDVEAGIATELPLLITNPGTAALADVSLRATPPRGWDVGFSPESVDRIEPGGTAEVTATITPSSDAIAGDYRITLRANVAETNDSIEVRATVKTSAVWGLVGIAVILLALGILAAVFRRFGRR